MIGLDTTAIIDLFKGVPEAKEAMEPYRKQLAVTQLNYAELLFGLDMEQNSHQEEASFYDDFLKTVLYLRLSDQALKQASKQHWKLQKEGKTVPQFDLLIMAIYRTHGITRIITRNTSHFSRIDELEVLEY